MANNLETHPRIQCRMFHKVYTICVGDVDTTGAGLSIRVGETTLFPYINNRSSLFLVCIELIEIV